MHSRSILKFDWKHPTFCGPRLKIVALVCEDVEEVLKFVRCSSLNPCSSAEHINTTKQNIECRYFHQLAVIDVYCDHMLSESPWMKKFSFFSFLNF